jgi:hypothetical protein
MPKMTASASGASSNDTKVSFISITIPVAIRNLCSQPCHHTPLARCVSSSLSLARTHTVSLSVSVSVCPPLCLVLFYLATVSGLVLLFASTQSRTTRALQTPNFYCNNFNSKTCVSRIERHRLHDRSSRAPAKDPPSPNPSLRVPRWSSESLWRNPLNPQPYVRTYLITYLPTFLPTYSGYVGPSRFNRPVTAQLPVTTYPSPANSY